MKQLFFAFVLTCLGLTSQAQITTKGAPLEDEPVLKSDANALYSSAEVEELPDFPGGLEYFFRYIEKNFKAPTTDFEARTMVTFTVEKDGTLTDIKIARNTNTEGSDELVRVLKSSPKWKPAKIKKTVVRCDYAMPILFPIQKSIDRLIPTHGKN